MSDLIKREQAIKAMQESGFGYTFEVDVAIEAVKALPTVEPEEMGKMNEDIISRKEMIRAVDSLGEDYISYYKLLLLIVKMPSACQTTKGKTGHWIDTDNYYQRWKCSECGYHTRDAEPNYCPHCGTKMEWVNNE